MEKLSPVGLSRQSKGESTMLRRSLWLYASLTLLLLFGLIAIVAAQEVAQPKKLNPYTGNPEAITEGRARYLQFGCSGCHGVGGGGGMGPALLDDDWKFGSDDDTLFKLIKGEIPQQTMPSVFGNELKDDDVWKILAYVRSLYRGDPSRINW
jgi:cytochrome c(L)